MKRRKNPPSKIVGYHHINGKPILQGRLGRRVGTDTLLIVDCPGCGATNIHGISDDAPWNVPQHKASDCDCWAGGYYVVPPAAGQEVAAK